MRKALGATAVVLAILTGVAVSGPAMAAGKAKAVRKPPVAAAVEPPSATVLALAKWARTTDDNHDLPFIVIDKKAAEVFVFDADGKKLGGTPALLGLAFGDNSTPGVGDRELSDIAPQDRTTPAGRFQAAYGPGPGKEKVFWVDYGTAISLHPVITSNPKERRPQRLRSPSVADNRITFGCINVPARFYSQVVHKTFGKSRGIVYILPEVEPLGEVFPAFQLQLASQGNAAQP
ncbi:MAG TPA: L,D-transpeptidase [Caulobacteraceae bacterium]|nr:L,D-transpeptidase [Caulobacteraceae bacterium]